MHDNVPAIVMRYFALDADHDVEAIVALFTEDATATDEGETCRGIDAIRAWRTGPAAEYEYATTITGRGPRRISSSASPRASWATFRAAPPISTSTSRSRTTTYEH